jgi:hypothetical protein
LTERYEVTLKRRIKRKLWCGNIVGLIILMTFFVFNYNVGSSTKPPSEWPPWVLAVNILGVAGMFVYGWKHIRFAERCNRLLSGRDS